MVWGERGRREEGKGGVGAGKRKMVQEKGGRKEEGKGGGG